MYMYTWPDHQHTDHSHKDPGRSCPDLQQYYTFTTEICIYYYLNTQQLLQPIRYVAY